MKKFRVLFIIFFSAISIYAKKNQIKIYKDDFTGEEYAKLYLDHAPIKGNFFNGLYNVDKVQCAYKKTKASGKISPITFKCRVFIRDSRKEMYIKIDQEIFKVPITIEEDKYEVTNQQSGTTAIIYYTDTVGQYTQEMEDKLLKATEVVYRFYSNDAPDEYLLHKKKDHLPLMKELVNTFNKK